MNATREVSKRGKCDGYLTEELASLNTEYSDTLHDVTEELAPLKTEKGDTVQSSVNLVTEQSQLQSNLQGNHLLDATVSIGPSLCSVTEGHHFLSN